MTREPTEAEVAAFSAAWEAENREQAEGRHLNAKRGDRVRAGLRALYALQEAAASEAPRMAEQAALDEAAAIYHEGSQG